MEHDGSHSSPTDDQPWDKERERQVYQGNQSSPVKDGSSSSSFDLEKKEEPGDKGIRENDIEKGMPESQHPAKDPNLIEFDGPDDPDNPQNFKFWKKWVYTIMYGLTTFAITYASSTFSSANKETAKQFNVSQEVMVLGTSLFVLGFAFGPPVWGPLSELYGRKPPLFASFFIFAVFQIAVAVSTKLYSVMICRFFGGFFGSAPLAIVGGALADLWNPVERGYALVVFAGATFVGPSMGPIIGSFITESYLGWRWTEYMTAIIGFTVGIIAFLVVPETFPQRILHDKAKKIRYATKNWAIHSMQDENKITIKAIVEKYLLFPLAMLIREPILLLITIYISLVYGILYLFFESFPVAFTENRGWQPGVGSLPFISLLIGTVFGAIIVCLFTKYRYKPRLEAGKITPEERLVPMFVGGLLLPIGLFWFAWTSSPHISPWPQIISIAPVGAGILIVFGQGLNYLIDCYIIYAASALAANSLCRSWFGAGFPMFATGMYHNLGVPWATSLLAFLCCALYPAPIVFYYFGDRIRKYSYYNPQKKM